MRQPRNAREDLARRQADRDRLKPPPAPPPRRGGFASPPLYSGTYVCPCQFMTGALTVRWCAFCDRGWP